MKTDRRLWAPGKAAIILACLVPALWLVAGYAQTDDPAEAEQQLSEVRERIGKLERQIKKQLSQRSAAEQDLRKAERGESGVRRKLEEIGQALGATRERLATLESEIGSIRAELSQRVDELAQQIRTVYMTGRDDWLRSVLSQQDPAEIGRQLVYHSYVAKHRSELIDSVRADLDRLAAAEASARDERAQLEETQAVERERLAELSSLRENRKLALAKISDGIASRNDQVDRLRMEAEDLEVLLAELTRALASLSIDGAVPFADRKGAMQLPTTGRIIRKFGQSRADGRMRWDGILVGADAGEEVRAVHYGRVVYADWLPGMGLLVVLEHGDGYLSLYGHNQDVMADVGEWVDPDTVISHVGDSGGQAAAGLYFEIRKDGAPQNPSRWLAP
ncbi:MAG: murein hydrolase activator EnvC family protein [Gammaproteobacteria bacterium]